MGDSDTFCHDIARPTGPSKRKSLPRTYDQIKWMNDTMGRKPKGERNKSTSSSPPNTPTHSTPNRSQNSSKSEKELEFRRETSPSNIYPDLSDISDSFLNESIPGHFSSNRSFTQTDSSNDFSHDSSHSSHSPTKIKQTPLPKSKFDGEQLSRTPKRENPSVNNLRSEAQSQQENNGVALCSGIAVLAILLCFVLSWVGSSQTEDIFNKTEFVSKIKDLRELFPSQDNDVWRHFGTGIADVRTGKHRPAIFVLLADHNETTNCLAQKVAELARYTLRGTGDVVLNPDELENDTGKVLNFMENRMNQTKTAVVTDMLSIQPEALRAFHDICDEYNKLVTEAVYFFIMSSEGTGMATSSTNSTRLFAEEQLMKRFSKTIVEDTMRALIVRITSGAVLAIKEEKSIPCSK